MKKLRPWIFDHEGLIRMENPSELIFAILYLANKKRLRPLILLRRTYFAILLYCGIIKKTVEKLFFFKLAE